MVAHLECTKDHAHDLLERAVYGGSLKDIKTFYPDGMEFETEITAWQKIDWDSGIVTIEPSWAGSPAVELPVFPMFDLEEVCRCFRMEIGRARATEAQPCRFSQAELDQWFGVRVQEFEAAGTIPSRADDLDAAHEVFGKNIPRSKVRDVRNRLAPNPWHKQGRRPKKIGQN
jgi:hypothetical protein